MRVCVYIYGGGGESEGQCEMDNARHGAYSKVALDDMVRAE